MDCCDSENHHATIRIFYDVQRSVTAVPQQLPQQPHRQCCPVHSFHHLHLSAVIFPG